MLILIFVMFCAISQCVSINFIDLPGFGDDELEFLETKDSSAEDEMQSADADVINKEIEESKDQKDEGAEKKIEIKNDKDAQKNKEDRENEAKETKHGIGENIDDVNERKYNKNETKDESKENKDNINDGKNKINDTNTVVVYKKDKIIGKYAKASEKKDEVTEKTDDATEKKADAKEKNAEASEKNAADTEKKPKATEKKDEVTQKKVEVLTAKNKGNSVKTSLLPNGRRYWKVSAVPTIATTAAAAWIPDKDENIKSKINSLVQQTMHDTRTKVTSVQKLQDRHREKPAYRVGFILSMLKKSRDVLNQLFNIAVKHRDQWRALEQLKIFELIVHTNVDSTNLVRQLVEIHLIHVNNKNGNNKTPNAGPQLRSRVVLI